MLDIILNILTSGLPCVLLSLGIFLTYRILDFADLTAEGSFLIGAAVSAVLIFNGVNPWIATLISFISGACCGILTGVLNRYLKIPKLLSGIITMTACASISQLVMGAKKGNSSLFNSTISFSVSKTSATQTIYSLFAPWKEVVLNGKTEWVIVSPWGEIIKTAVMLLVVIIVMIGIYFFFGTEYGMAIRATGLNENMSNSQGINADITTIVCIGISNALIALGGSLYVQDANNVTTISAAGYLVIGLASILIGEAIFGKRSFKNWIISVALGAIIYFVIVTIATELGLPTQLKSLLYAVLITIALCLPLIKSGFQRLFKIKKIFLGRQENDWIKEFN